jgi:DDE superfamily endonuclease/Homeodomain-like domain
MPGPQPKYPIHLSEAQVAQLTHLSLSYSAPYGEVQRARILCLAHRYPEWTNTQIAHEVGCCRDTVKVWRQRWCQAPTIHSAPRPGAPRRFPAVVRAQVTALACTTPRDQGHVWKRWSGEKLAHVAVEKGIVEVISASTIRRWLRQDKIKPWRYHSWQKSTDPAFVAKATPVLDLYEHAQALAEEGEAVCCVDEKTSMQARQRVSETKTAVPGYPMQVADRYRRMGALQLFCALMVATGRTFARCRARKCFADFKAFLLEWFASALCQGLKVLPLILDNGSTHAPKQLGTWIASLQLAFEVRLYWLPTHASWLDQVEIIFSKVQREVLTPNDFPSTIALTRDLMAYFEELNRQPKPVQWTYTKAKLIAKFDMPSQEQLAA